MATWLDLTTGFGALNLYCFTSTSTADAIGSATLTTVGTAPTLTDGPCGRVGWRFSSGSLVRTSGMPSNQPFTMEVWIRTTSLAFQTAAMIRSDTDFEVGGVSMGAGAAGVVPSGASVAGQVVFRRAGSSLLATGTHNNGKWHQVVISAGSSLRELYVDGVPHSSYSAGTATGTPTGIRIGANGYIPGSVTQQWDGDISSVAVYDTQLTASQVWQLWLAGSCKGGWSVGFLKW